MYIIQLMTFDEVNTRIDQPMEHDINRGIRAVGMKGGESEGGVPPLGWRGPGCPPLKIWKF